LVAEDGGDRDLVNVGIAVSFGVGTEEPVAVTVAVVDVAEWEDGEKEVAGTR
jgi:hypothetical protein